MKPLVVHAFFVGQPGTAGYPRLMQTCAVGAVQEETNSFSKETPSLSLRLRSVQFAQADSYIIRRSSNRVRSRSVCVSLQFECAGWQPSVAFVRAVTESSPPLKLVSGIARSWPSGLDT